MSKVLASILLCLPLTLAATPDAHADGKQFVDVPLTLPPLHFGGEAGIGFGTYQTTNVSVVNGASSSSSSTQVGWGSNLDAAIGLPFIGEIGARVGYRFGAHGVGAYANHYARLFDPITSENGANNFDNVDMHLRGSLVGVEVFELGLETRIVIPTDSTSVVAFTPGVPMRIHIPQLLRIDTGLWLSVPAQSNQYYVLVLDVPAQAYFQIGDAFVGPQTGVRFTNPGGGAGSYAEVPLGLGGGYTFGGVLDVKAQLRTEHVNSSPSPLGFGGGLGVGIRVP